MIGAFLVGLSLLVASVTPAPMPYSATSFPQSVSLIPDSLNWQLSVDYSSSVNIRFKIDFTQTSWNVESLTSSTYTMLFDDYWYVGTKAAFRWYTDEDDLTHFEMKSLEFIRLESYNSREVLEYSPFPVAWLSTVSGPLNHVYENGSAFWHGLAIGTGNTNAGDSTVFNDNGFSHDRYFFGTNPSYSLTDANFAIFKSRIENRVYSHALSAYESFSKGYATGYDNGKAVGFSQGRQEGYNDGLNASSDSALAGSLFGAIIAVPLDVLNGLNTFVLWGMPIVAVLLTFLLVGVIISIVKKFI